MLLFKPQHVGPIQRGEKTQTRRLWPHGCRVKVGSVYQCRTRMLDRTSTFAWVRVKRVWQERLGDISDADARAEGYTDKWTYMGVFMDINGGGHSLTPVWAVEFEVVLP